MKRKILFRVDAGEKVGLGHFFRSYSLAKALAQKGYAVTFVHTRSGFWDTLDNFEFPHSILQEKNSSKETINICLNGKYEILYVDGIIDFDSNDINTLKDNAKLVFYQNLSESRYLADVYILPSLHQKESFFEKFNNIKTQIYQGLEYFTFNEKIRNLGLKEIQSDDCVNDIGIICGGSDPRNVMLMVYKLIDFLKWENITFNFYFGENYMHHNSIPQSTPKNVNFLAYDISVINNSDMLIAVFGVSTYEFMALGMPIISIAHQQANAHASEVLEHKTASICHLGLIDNIKTTELNTTIAKFVKDIIFRRSLNKNSKMVLDFNGIERVVKILERI
ncbi:hypothetical protein [Maribacter luteus]|uniref:UDP-2,4-diacetamido-2,4, 6-trideoxy-beta-L-altropyranose hydrolase n=1 Tax=Maribacter luteus TaxID=2594478 RepID=A0A6I2MNJ9_9FLAO|nr:hypothetical protein [Maribacter luteus]MRX64309.1 hypothetical protein [Maribacter luteus]